MASKISIIIVNYNTWPDLKNCLDSIRKAGAGLELQVIVVDNASHDGSAAKIAAAYPKVELIANQTNTGFVVANNQGIERAAGDYILLLNPDTILFEDTLAGSLEFMDERPEIGCLGIRTLTRSGNVFPNGNTFPSEIKTLARILMLREILPNAWIRKHLAASVGKYVSAYSERDSEREVDMVGGYYLFLRSAAVKKAGLLEEAYWADIEDSDYCRRIWLAGYKVVYWPGATVIHLIGSSIERRLFSENTFLRVNQNTMLFFRRHYTPWRLHLLRLIYVGTAPLQMIMALCLPFCMGREKAQTAERIRAAARLAGSALILPDKIRYAKPYRD